MSKVQKISETPFQISFDFLGQYHEQYWSAFLSSDLGKIYLSIPWDELIKSFELKTNKLGRKDIFSPRGKLALMILKSYTGLSDKKLMSQLNANYEYQFFCDIIIPPNQRLTNFKIISDIRVELSHLLEIKNTQQVLAQYWKTYMSDTDSILEDATCYESYVRYPTDVKLLWESNQWVYGQIKKINKVIKGCMPRSKYGDQKTKYLSYSKQRKKTYKQTRKRIKSLLYLLDKQLAQLSEILLLLPASCYMPKLFYQRLSTILKVLEQQSKLFDGEKVQDRIVSISKSYIRPIVRGKESKRVEFGAKANIVQIDKIDFIEHISFDAFNEGTRLQTSVAYVQELFETKVKLLGADAIYATNANRKFSSSNQIITSFVPKGKKGKHENNLSPVRKIINIKRATEMEGSFGKHKNFYTLDKVKARTEKTELLWIFFGIHTANALEIGRRICSQNQQVEQKTA